MTEEDKKKCPMLFSLWEDYRKNLEQRGLVLTEENEEIGFRFFIEGMVRYSLADRHKQVIIDNEIIQIVLPHHNRAIIKL